MAVTTFGVTAAQVRQKHLPMLPDFSSASAPTQADVTDFINEGAGDLEGRLKVDGISVTAIAAQPSTTAAYLWCVKYIRMYAAVEAASAATAVEPEVAKRLRTKLEAMQTRLEDGGADALGEGAASSSQSDPDGPTTTLAELGLDAGSDDDDVSDFDSPFRKDDQL